MVNFWIINLRRPPRFVCVVYSVKIHIIWVLFSYYRTLKNEEVGTNLAWFKYDLSQNNWLAFLSSFWLTSFILHSLHYYFVKRRAKKLSDFLSLNWFLLAPFTLTFPCFLKFEKTWECKSERNVVFEEFVLSSLTALGKMGLPQCKNLWSFSLFCCHFQALCLKRGQATSGVQRRKNPGPQMIPRLEMIPNHKWSPMWITNDPCRKTRNGMEFVPRVEVLIFNINRSRHN